MSGNLIGREAQLEELRALAAAAAAGRGALVLIRGEAGVGKTALARAAVADNELMLIEAASTEIPAAAYAPVAAILRAARRAEAMIPANRVFRGALAAILPELDPEGGSAATEPAVLFEAVAGALEDLARGRPIAILLDDAHWADAATLDLAGFLADVLVRLPVLLILTYRTEGISRMHPIRDMRSRLKRKGGLIELTLEPFDEAGTTALLNAHVGAAVAPGLAALVHDRSEGLPFFIEELAASLVESGSLRQGSEGLELDPGATLPVPEAVRDVVLQRVDRLRPADRDALAIAAVAGTEATVSLLAEFGLDDATRLIASGLLVDFGGGRLGFRHSLARDAVYDSIPWRRRRTLHAALVARLAGSAPPLTIAAHSLAAGDAAGARSWLVTAAAESRRAGAHRVAAEQLSHALELWPAEVDVEGRVDVLEQLARSAELAGMTTLAIRAVAETVELLEETPDRGRYAAAQRWLAALLEVQGAWERALDARQAAAAAYAEAGMAAEAAAEWLASAAKLRSAASFKAALAVIATGLEAAEQARRTDLIRRLRALEGNVRARAGEGEDALAIVREALNDALAGGDHAAAAEAYQRLADSLEHAGDYRAARATYQEAAEFCHANGADTIGEVCLACLTMVLRQTGDWDRAVEVCQAVADSPSSNDHARAVVHGVLGSILLHRGSLRQARSELHASNALAKRIGLTAMEMDSEAHLARLAVLEDRAEDAADRCWNVIRRWRRTDGERHYVIPNLRWIATFAAEVPNSQLLDACSAAVTAVVAARDVEAQAALHHVLGEAALAAGEPASAAARFDQALDILSDLDLPLERAEVGRRSGGAHALAGDRRLALDRYRAAHRTARRLGARHLAQRIAGEVAALGEKVERRLGRLAASGLHSEGLSPRELEVVRLVAEGLTSREVAQRLTLSPRTIEMHVHRALIKLNCRSRVEVTRRAAELGLLA
jgi:DNA-binding CsgD family transcriptional regulator